MQCAHISNTNKLYNTTATTCGHHWWDWALPHGSSSGLTPRRSAGRISELDSLTFWMKDLYDLLFGIWKHMFDLCFWHSGKTTAYFCGDPCCGLQTGLYFCVSEGLNEKRSRARGALPLWWRLSRASWRSSCTCPCSPQVCHRTPATAATSTGLESGCPCAAACHCPHRRMCTRQVGIRYTIFLVGERTRFKSANASSVKRIATQPTDFMVSSRQARIFATARIFGTLLRRRSVGADDLQ